MAGIYIHIPFCKKICFYCDFYKILSPEDKSQYIKAIIREAEMRRTYISGENISTIYLGGGTPSVLSVKELDLLMKGIRNYFTIDEACETTIELNPDDINADYVKGLQDTGFNRISLGIQSWRDEDLRLLNRRHTAKQAEESLELVLKSGFSNVSIDLIYGIPGLDLEGWDNNLEKSFRSDIKHLSAYHLTIEQGTVFGKMKKEGHLKETEEEESINQFNTLVEKAEKNGFIHYEISNLGREGFFSGHNTNYWKQVGYIGLGPGAHSFNHYSRQWNIKDVKRYIKLVMNDEIFYEREELSRKTKFNEYLMTSLRTMWGIDLDYVENAFEKEGYDYIINLSKKFKDYGLMIQNGNNLTLTNQGKMISDNIIAEFMMEDKA